MTPTQVSDAITYNTKEYDEGDLSPEMIVRLVEHWQESHSLDADGKAGPMTQQSIQNSMDVHWDQPEPPCGGDWDGFENGKWLTYNGPESIQPKINEKISYFGNPETSPGSDVMSKTWYRANIVECHETQGNRLPGIPARLWIKTHKMVEPYIREALRRVQLTCPEYAITKLGSYNFRHIQHNPNKPLSTHSFGAAFDVNPPDNSGEHYAKGKAPAFGSPKYVARWPRGVPAAFVQCFTSCGFAWGSDWNEDGRTEDHTFLDPMHFEWVARDGIKTEV